MGITVKSEFWTSDSRYGVIHARDAGPAGGNPNFLVVFVHGIFGDCKNTWGAMPEWVLAKAKVDADAISFSYPSKAWQKCSIAQAADDLEAWLDTEFKEHRQIILVTHSTGGLIVKQMLRGAFERIRFDIEQKRLDYSNSDSIWFKTRKVINIAVPHHGGSPLISIGGAICHFIFYLLAALFLRIVRFLSQGGKDWGKNEIIPALRWKNPWLLKLEKDFLEQQKKAEDLDLPFPHIFDIQAKADLSVPYRADMNTHKLYFRGTHKSIKIPQRKNAPIVSIVGSIIRPYAENISTAIVDHSLERIALVNRTTATRSLIKTPLGGIGSDRDAPSPSLPSASYGSQSDVVEQIVASIQAGHDKPKQLVVTGAAGVGKSLVTRMIAWRLGLNYLAEPGAHNPLPLFIPLQQITVTELNDNQYFWQLLWDWWINWGKSMYPDVDCDKNWLEDRFHHHPVTIILDGLDDFLHNHPIGGFSTVLLVLRERLKRYCNNSGLTIIVGIRSTIHGFEKLATEPKDVFEVLRLSVIQAKQIYPTCQAWIDTVQDHTLLDFILTPLILSNYEPDPTFHPSSDTMTQSALLYQAIRTILSRSNLVGLTTEQGESVELNHLSIAMTLIAWLFYYKSRGEINIEVLRLEASEHCHRWRRFFDHTRAEDENFFFESLSVQMAEIMTGFNLAHQASICGGLLQRTVFVPTGPGMVRFAHRQWQEFLLGQYLSFCIRTHHFDELGFAAFHSRIYRMAGESYGSRIVTEGCVRALFQTWEKTRNTYITGNVIAFLTWTKTAVEPKAIQLLLNELNNFGELSRLVLMGGLAYRILRNHKDDVSLSDLKRALFPKLKEFSNPATAPIDDPVVSSMSWCYQKSFAECLGSEAPDNTWPRIGFDDAETLKALSMICTVKNDEFILDERSKSLQVAFLVPVIDAFKDPDLLIRAVHYLYYLVVARKHDVHVMELTQTLPQLLAPGCEFEKILAGCHGLPELFELYQSCQKMHARLEAAAV